MRAYRFYKFIPSEKGGSNFEKLLNLFQELLTYTSGDVAEALDWLTQIDNKYSLTDNQYGIGDFIKDLYEKGYLKENDAAEGGASLTAKMEQTIRQKSLEEIFGKLKKSKRGNHTTKFDGQGDELSADKRPFQFGDTLEQISMTDSIRNAQINHGIGDFHLLESDLEVMESEFKAQTSTVLMIDISHSMILYGEDRITPAKKVAMALSELIMQKYPKDTLDIIVFGNDAWQISVKDLPYLQVGPYHTNTVAGLELAMDLLRKRKNPNKHIFMITDGKPTCIKEGINYYKNSFGLDRKILNKTFNLAKQCRRLKIPVTTFMIAKDNYLREFVQEFTEINQGKAFYTSLQGLGEFIFEDYESNRRKKVR
jgi:Ca-activated chloride channel family protein